MAIDIENIIKEKLGLNINFERLVARGVAKFVSDELDLAGIKMQVNTLLQIAIIPSAILFVVVAFYLFSLHVSPLLDVLGGVAAAALYSALIYMYLEYKIDQRKSKLESMLPDFLQITAANLRSGIALERAMLLAARPEFGFLSDDVKDISKRVFGGETLEASLQEFTSRYRSYSLQHAVRMILEALKYGGAMADLIVQISQDMRNQQITQREIAGQLLMYSIFVAFAAIIAAPVLYGLTTQMIVITDGVWKGILASNPGGLPSAGVSFLKPSPPKISIGDYENFSYVAIIIITGFASLIMAAISSGAPVRGLRYMPVFILAGVVIYLIVQGVVGGLFSTIGGV